MLGLIIFDEPTTSLSERETEKLFALIARLRARSIAIIYISHTLADVFRLCDDIKVLHDGEVVGTGATKTFTSVVIFISVWLESLRNRTR